MGCRGNVSGVVAADFSAQRTSRAHKLVMSGRAQRKDEGGKHGAPDTGQLGKGIRGVTGSFL